MDGRPKRRASAQRRSIAVSAMMLVAIGATVIAGPANADTPDPSAPLLTATAVRTTSSVATVAVIRSTNAVYPVKDGYLDTARFEVIATDADGRLVPVVGTATLTSRGQIVRTWRIDSARTGISWDGRVAHAIRTGLYALTATVTSADGTIRTGEAMMRVLGKRLVRHEFVTYTRVDKRRTVKLLPSRLLAAYAFGQVEFRIETVAVVHGRAKLIFTNNGVVTTVPLRNGTHVTPKQTLPQGFDRVTVIHGWAPGAARLLQLKTIWIHSDLE